MASGGDEWATGSPFYYAEQLSGRDWTALRSSFYHDVAQIGLWKATYNFYRFGIGPLVPEPVLRLRRKLLASDGPNGFDSTFWLSPELEVLYLRRRAAIGDSQSGFRQIARIARC